MYVIDITPAGCLRRRLRPNSLIVNNLQYPERRRTLTIERLYSQAKQEFVESYYFFIANDLLMVYF